MDEADAARAGAAASADASSGEHEIAAEIHALMVRANMLFKQKRYREARAVSRHLAELDPSAFMPEQIIEACSRQIARRRAIFLGAVVALAATGLLLFAVYRYLAHPRISCRPEPGTIEMREAETRQFAVSSTFGRHRNLEYTWLLLGPTGQAMAGPERAAAKPDEGAPWSCSYSPSYGVATARPDDALAVRTLTVSAVDEEGKEAATFRWTLHVANVAKPPTLLRAEPPTRVPVFVTAGREQAFRIEAVDGDGGLELTYQWFLDDRLQPTATTATWAYATPADPQGRSTRHIVICRMGNRFGEPLVQSIAWTVIVTPEPQEPK